MAKKGVKSISCETDLQLENMSKKLSYSEVVDSLLLLDFEAMFLMTFALMRSNPARGIGVVLAIDKNSSSVILSHASLLRVVGSNNGSNLGLVWRGAW
jgi:hypothetical protein